MLDLDRPGTSIGSESSTGQLSRSSNVNSGFGFRGAIFPGRRDAGYNNLQECQVIQIDVTRPPRRHNVSETHVPEGVTYTPSCYKFYVFTLLTLCRYLTCALNMLTKMQQMVILFHNYLVNQYNIGIQISVSVDIF